MLENYFCVLSNNCVKAGITRANLIRNRSLGIITTDIIIRNNPKYIIQATFDLTNFNISRNPNYDRNQSYAGWNINYGPELKLLVFRFRHEPKTNQN